MTHRFERLGLLALVGWLAYLLVANPAVAGVYLLVLVVPLVVVLPFLVVTAVTRALEFEVPGEPRTVCLPGLDVCIEL